MNAEQKIARTVGVLLLIGTVAGLLCVAFTGSSLSDPDYLTKISTNKILFITGVLTLLTMAFMLAMVPVLMFPIFKEYNETLALGCVVFRGVLEPLMYMAIAISWLLLLSLGQKYMIPEISDYSCHQMFGIINLEAAKRIGQILDIVFSLGALMFYLLFYQSKLIPRWLSVWGLIGAVLYLSVPLSGMFGIAWEILYSPLAMQEMVLAVWLIIKGFNLSAMPTESNSLPSCLYTKLKKSQLPKENSRFA